MRINELPTPAYVLDEKKLKENLEILRMVEEKAECRILLAQKAFSMFYMYPLIGKYISGTTASGLYEAKLGKEEMGKENHIFSPAYREEEIDEIAEICDHVIFNSFSQLRKYKERCKGKTSIGLRINPECSTQEDHAIYDPCASGSRLGITLANFLKEVEENPSVLDGVEGFHFHTLCEQNADALEITLKAVEEKFDPYLKKMKWLNMGGGHHITREDYDVECLIRCIRHMRETYGVEVYLEPGEAVALNAGYLVTEVMDIVENGMKILILDASAACHMPDVLEMPYRPPLLGADEPGENAVTIRLGGPTCLSGDIIGDYSFSEPLKYGDILMFGDMAIYTTCKNNTFNGMPLPDIWLRHGDKTMERLTDFGYEDFKGRLGRCRK